jgi:hypothetical protein
MAHALDNSSFSGEASFWNVQLPDAVIASAAAERRHFASHQRELVGFGSSECKVALALCAADSHHQRRGLLPDAVIASAAAERRHFASHQRELVGENREAQSAGGTADLPSLRDFSLARSESHQLTLVASEMSPLRGCRSDNCVEQQPLTPVASEVSPSLKPEPVRVSAPCDAGYARRNLSR